MYSALKHEGKALYEYARAGVNIERQARKVTIKAITLNTFSGTGTGAELTITCSKGTYIRTLAEDIGVVLGCDAHLAGLRRTETAGYAMAQTVDIEQLEAMTMEERDALLLPVDSAIEHFPKIILDEAAAQFFKQGQAIWQAGEISAAELRIYEKNGLFIGLGKLLDDGKIAPKRLVNLRTT
jgi:tRNA pseudouridine55 synthase